MSLIVAGIAGTSFAVSSGLGAGALLLGGALVAANNGPKQGANSGGAGPDLAKANAAAIMADIETLPMRLGINQAAQNGGLYQDSKTGQIFDFRGKFDPMRFFAETPGAWDYYVEEGNYVEEGKAMGSGPRPDVEGFAKDFLGGQGIHGPAADAKIKSFTTSSPEYKAKTEATLQAQQTTAGTQLAVDTSKTQLDALTGKDDYAGYVRRNADLLAEFEKNGGGMSIEEWGKRHFETYGKAEGRKLVNDGLATGTNDLNLRLQNDALDQQIAGTTRATTAAANLQTSLLPQLNDTLRTEQRKTFDANLDANGAAFNANLTQADAAARRATASQLETVPQLNDLALRNQNAAFNQNLTQSDTAAARSLAQQRTTLPGLNDLSLQLQTQTLRGADAAGRSVNPNTYAARDQLGQNILDGLKAGDSLTESQSRRVQQNIRGAQAARGNILGDGAAFDEAIAQSDYAQRIGQGRRTDALNFINARDLNPNFSSVGVVNPTQVVAPNSRAYENILNPTQLVTPNSRGYENIINPTQTVAPNNAAANFQTQTNINPLMPNFSATTVGAPNLTPITAPSANPLALLNPNAGTNAQGAALSAWTTNTNNAANTPNPWMQGLGLGLQAWSTFNRPGAGAGASVTPNTSTNLGMGGFSPVCWVARAVLGTADARWRMFRAWLLLRAPEDFRARYLRRGERFAAWLENQPGVRAVLRPWFEARAAEMEALA